MNTSSRVYSYTQRGMATLAILILVGFAVSVAVFGALRFLQGSQSQTTAYHSQTQAQMKAWAGVDMLFQYLQKISAAEMKTLLEASAVSPQTVNFNTAGNLAAIFYKVNNDLHASITGTAAVSTKAEANSTIEVIFHQIEPVPKAQSPSGCSPLCTDHPQSVLSFNRDLKLNGTISVSTPPGTSYSINVKGLLDADEGNSISGVDTINATDSIRIGSGSSFNTLNSNGDIRLTGSVSGNGNLNARGNICLIGGTSANGSVRANGFVYGDGGASFGDIQSIGVSNYTGNYRSCDTYALNDRNGKPFGVNMVGNNAVRSVKSKASVRFNSGSVSNKPGVLAEGDLRDTNWEGEQFGTIGGKIENEGNNPAVIANIQVVPGYKVSITPVEEMSGTTPIFDAYVYEGIANYSFQRDAKGYKTVTVRNVNGIPNGQYFLGSYDGPYKDRLCTALTSNSSTTNAVCSQPVNPAQSYRLCWGQSEYNSCFSYDVGSKKWDIDGKGIAQGIAWFEGNLNVGNGVYYNTFIATGNITTSGQHKNVAPNFAGASGGNYNYSIRHSQWWTENRSETFKGICSNGTSPNYPIQLCNAFNANVPLPIANYAYMAGSIVNKAYIGGNIHLAASTNVFGSILAGNEYNSGGDTFVLGYLTALGGGVETGNKMGGSTKIVITNFPKTYTPIGGIETGSGSNQGGAVESTPCKICLARDEYTSIKFSARYQ